jgi:hypothetical protein
LDDVAPSRGGDPFDGAIASLDVSNGPAAVVLEGVMPLAERIQVLESGFSAVFPCEPMVEFAT